MIPHPKRRRPPGPSGRDLGLVSADAGKGDAPRNLSAKFRENFDLIDFNTPDNPARFTRLPSGKLVRVYK